MTPPLNDHTAKLLMYHIHKIGLATSAFLTDLQGTPALTVQMHKSITEIELGVARARQEIIDLRDGKANV